MTKRARQDMVKYMEYELPPKEEILDFLEKNCLEVKDVMAITGKGKVVYDWFKWLRGENSKAQMPWDAWLLLNALFNRRASFVTEIIKEYSRGVAFVENPELVQEFSDEVKVMKDAVQYWNEMTSMERHEEEVERINKEHIERVMKEYYNRRGTGPKVENREAYKQIKGIENTLGIPSAIAIQKFEELSKEYKVKGMNGKNSRFIENLLKIYDGYFEQLREADLMKYLGNLGVAIADWGERKSTADIKNLVEIKDKKGKDLFRFLANTPEQAEEIRNLIQKSHIFEKYLKKQQVKEYEDENEFKKWQREEDKE